MRDELHNRYRAAMVVGSLQAAFCGMPRQMGRMAKRHIHIYGQFSLKAAAKQGKRRYDFFTALVDDCERPLLPGGWRFGIEKQRDTFPPLGKIDHKSEYDVSCGPVDRAVPPA